VTVVTVPVQRSVVRQTALRLSARLAPPETRKRPLDAVAASVRTAPFAGGCFEHPITTRIQEAYKARTRAAEYRTELYIAVP
jgi:hypothetical protein